MRLFRIVFFVLIACAFTFCQSEQSDLVRPNIIFIMSDDHAVRAVSAYGDSLIHTPNLDRIANEGMLFKNSFVTNSICAPSRAVMLTGKYSHLNGLRDNRDEFDGSQITFPKLLQMAGYQTSIIGKWHLKTTPTAFDYWNILIDQGEYYNPRMIEMGDTLNHIGYTSDLITDMALDQLSKRDLSKPFCMLFHHKAPHRNWMPNPKYFDLFKDKEIPIPANLHDDYTNRTRAAREQDLRIEDMFLSMDMKLHEEYYGTETGTGGGPKSFDAGRSWKNSYERLTPEQKAAWDAHYDPINKKYKEARLTGKALTEWKYRRYMEDYLASVASVDESVGRILDYLDQYGLAENTIIVYTSDQGFYLGEHGWYDKRFMYEESLRMPLMIRYPKAVQSGSYNEDIVLNLDFAPTFLDFAGIDIPDDMQGRSLRSIMSGKAPSDWRTSMYYEYFEFPHGWHSVKKHYGVRTKDYKLIRFYDDNWEEWELFDLAKDPNEMNNVSEDPSYQKLRQELFIELNKLRRSTRAEGS